MKKYWGRKDSAQKAIRLRQALKQAQTPSRHVLDRLMGGCKPVFTK